MLQVGNNRDQLQGLPLVSQKIGQLAANRHLDLRLQRMADHLVPAGILQGPGDL